MMVMDGKFQLFKMRERREARMGSCLAIGESGSSTRSSSDDGEWRQCYCYYYVHLMVMVMVMHGMAAAAGGQRAVMNVRGWRR